MHYHRLGLAEYFKLEHSGKARAGGRGRKVGKYRQCGGKGGDMLKGFWADIAKQQRAFAPNRAAVFGFVRQRGNCYPEICKRKEIQSIIYYVLLVIGMIAMMYILSMTQYHTRTYPRFIWTFYAIQSMLLLIAFWLLSKKGKEILCYLCCGYLLIHLLFCNIIVSNHVVSNTLDKTYAMMVYEKIVAYEEATGETVTKICCSK